MRVFPFLGADAPLTYNEPFFFVGWVTWAMEKCSAGMSLIFMGAIVRRSIFKIVDKK